MKLLQINPVLRVNTSTGRIMQEIGELAMNHGWESYIAYSGGRDGVKPCRSHTIPVGDRWSVAWHGVMTRLFDRHGLASDRATREFIEEIKRIKPDVIHIHNIHGYFLNYKILFDYLAQSNIPVVWTVHDCWLYTGHCFYYSFAGCNKWKSVCNHCPQQREFPASLLVDRSERNFADKRAAFTSMPHDKLTIVPVSQWMRSEMEQSFLNGYDFRVIHNGINLDTFTPSDTDKEVREIYGLQGKHLLLGVASVWSREKGIDDFIRLSTMLADDEQLVLVGVSDDIAKRLPASIKVIRRTENIGQLAQLYSAATAFVNLTWQDNYPTVNLEAIACGTPVVTYRTGGSVESVTDETGIVVEQGNLEQVVQAVRTIEQRGKEHYRCRCREYALKHFDKEERYKDYIRLYNEVLK